MTNSINETALKGSKYKQTKAAEEQQWHKHHSAKGNCNSNDNTQTQESDAVPEPNPQHGTKNDEDKRRIND